MSKKKTRKSAQRRGLQYTQAFFNSQRAAIFPLTALQISGQHFQTTSSPQDMLNLVNSAPIKEAGWQSSFLCATFLATLLTHVGVASDREGILKVVNIINNTGLNFFSLMEIVANSIYFFMDGKDLIEKGNTGMVLIICISAVMALIANTPELRELVKANHNEEFLNQDNSTKKTKILAILNVVSQFLSTSAVTYNFIKKVVLSNIDYFKLHQFAEHLISFCMGLGIGVLQTAAIEIAKRNKKEMLTEILRLSLQAVGATIVSYAISDKIISALKQGATTSLNTGLFLGAQIGLPVLGSMLTIIIVKGKEYLEKNSGKELVEHRNLLKK